MMRSAATRALLVALTLAIGAGACASTPPQRAEEVAVAAAAVTEDRYPEVTATFGGGVSSRPDVVYARIAGYRPLTLDLYTPSRAETAPYPIVLFIHGGAWQHGDARHAGAIEDFPAWLAQLAARGFIVASVNYRLSGEARFPAALNDAKIALRWLRSQASTLGADPDRVVVWGVSAGGQIAGLMALGCDDPALDVARNGALRAAGVESLAAENDCVQGAVLWYAASDLIALTPADAADPAASPEARYLGCAPEMCAPLASAASPTSRVRADGPPMLFIHGRSDVVVPFSQSQQLDARLRSIGGRSELLALQGVGHSFVGAAQADTSAATHTALRATTRFIEEVTGHAVSAP
jgi:acetyl esterase/lipase